MRGMLRPAALSSVLARKARVAGSVTQPSRSTPARFRPRGPARRSRASRHRPLRRKPGIADDIGPVMMGRCGDAVSASWVIRARAFLPSRAIEHAGVVVDHTFTGLSARLLRPGNHGFIDLRYPVGFGQGRGGMAGRSGCPGRRRTTVRACGGRRRLPNLQERIPAWTFARAETGVPSADGGVFVRIR